MPLILAAEPALQRSPSQQLTLHSTPDTLCTKLHVGFLPLSQWSLVPQVLVKDFVSPYLNSTFTQRSSIPEGQVISVFEHLSQDSALLHTLHLRLITVGKMISQTLTTTLTNFMSLTGNNSGKVFWSKHRLGDYFLGCVIKTRQIKIPEIQCNEFNCKDVIVTRIFRTLLVIYVIIFYYGHHHIHIF